MPRRKSTRDIKKWTLHLDAQIASRVEQALLDPMTGKVITGSRGKLIESLLEDTLSGIEEGRLAVDPFNGTIYERQKETHQ